MPRSRSAVRKYIVSLGLLALAGPLLASARACAQNYPDHPVKIIVPIGPAGSYDIVGRLLADQLTKRFGQSAVVENRPGAGTIVGTQAAINAPAAAIRSWSAA
jgi:tripartite-type tricarboxylate transporter receptor subunit TctC